MGTPPRSGKYYIKERSFQQYFIEFTRTIVNFDAEVSIYTNKTCYI